MNIVLYYAPVTCALVSYVSLTETGADFEVRKLNFRKNEHKSPEYLAINPKHKVPLLIVDGKKLSENVAIVHWLNRTFPQAQLLPSDPWQEAQAISIMGWCSSGIHPFLTRTNAPERVCDVDGAGDSVKRLAAEMLHENYKIADDMLARRAFFFEHFTAADAHFFWTFRRGQQFGLDVSAYKNCMAHFELLQTRPSVQKALAFEKDVQAEFAKAA